jgi:hypothetical protein
MDATLKVHEILRAACGKCQTRLLSDCGVVKFLTVADLFEQDAEQCASLYNE